MLRACLDILTTFLTQILRLDLLLEIVHQQQEMKQGLERMSVEKKKKILKWQQELKQELQKIKKNFQQQQELPGEDLLKY